MSFPTWGTPLVLMVILTHWLILVIPNILPCHLLAEYLVGVPQSLQHVHNLKMDIQKQRLSAYEAELLLTLNNISGFEEALFELEKIKRKQDILKKYKDLFEAAQIEANQKVRIDSYQIDFAQMMHNKKELSDLQLQLRKSLDAELEKLENECYLA